MSTPNFASILDEAPTEVNAPAPLPQGTYLTVVRGQPRYDKSAKKGTPYVEFLLHPISAEPDVDEDELADAGGLDGKIIRATFWLTDEAVFMLDQFHEHCGLDLSDAASRRQRNDEVVNAQVRAFVKHETSQDGTRIFARYNRSLPAE